MYCANVHFIKIFFVELLLTRMIEVMVHKFALEIENLLEILFRHPDNYRKRKFKRNELLDETHRIHDQLHC